MSDFFNLNWGDLWRGVVVAILTGAWLSIAGLFVQGFDVFMADWLMIGKLAVNGAVFSFAGYITKNLITNAEGKVLGVG